MPKFYLDSETGTGKECYAVVLAPRKSRGRFQANCVELMESEAAAREAANAEQNRYAAKLVGPSKSSEGFMMYYLVRWLDERI